MSFTLVAYKKLKDSIYQSVKSELKHHKVGKIDELSLERRTQIHFLLKTIELLDDDIKLMEAEKGDPIHQQSMENARILNAATYFIHQKIANSYSYPVFLSSIILVTNSNLFNLLNTSLQITKDNTPDRDDLIDMYSTLKSFLYKHVYKKSDSRLGLLEKQPFYYEGYNIERDIDYLCDKLNAWEKEVRFEQAQKRSNSLSLAKKQSGKAARKKIPEETSAYVDYFGIGSFFNSTQYDSKTSEKSLPPATAIKSKKTEEEKSCHP